MRYFLYVRYFDVDGTETVLGVQSITSIPLLCRSRAMLSSPYVALRYRWGSSCISWNLSCTSLSSEARNYRRWGACHCTQTTLFSLITKSTKSTSSSVLSLHLHGNAKQWTLRMVLLVKLSLIRLYSPIWPTPCGYRSTRSCVLVSTTAPWHL